MADTTHLSDTKDKRHIPELMALLNSKNKEDRQQILEVIKKSLENSTSMIKKSCDYDIYLAVIPLHYLAPTGKEVNGLRPMGAVDNKQWESILGKVLDFKLEKYGLLDDMEICFNKLKTVGDSGFTGDDKLLVKKGAEVNIKDEIPITFNSQKQPWFQEPDAEELSSVLETIDTIVDQKQYSKDRSELPKVTQEGVEVILNWKEMWQLCKRLDGDKSYDYRLLHLTDWIKSADPSDVQTDGITILN
ncbi:hypothetical protein [Zooshikella harenae]|uniref:Uncharacterized protein n=1 Tax=Zooshikella harenae TaxID=2827238 RepID=A0ABS5ZGD9_9GAMM|nr:hypothetical protein [Zooshikella harenae]MBU2712047.1 hypothetical protein [Zooshikella harenae]